MNVTGVVYMTMVIFFLWIVKLLPTYDDLHRLSWYGTNSTPHLFRNKLTLITPHWLSGQVYKYIWLFKSSSLDDKRGLLQGWNNEERISYYLTASPQKRRRWNGANVLAVSQHRRLQNWHHQMLWRQIYILNEATPAFGQSCVLIAVSVKHMPFKLR